MAEHSAGRTRPERIGVVDAIPARQKRVDEGHGLDPGVSVSGRAAQVDCVQELAQAEVLGERCRQHEAGVGDETVLVEVHGQPVETVG